MGFDPFQDGNSKGYLRNFHGLALGKKLKRAERQDFCLYLPDALRALAEYSKPGYTQLREVHETLFGGLYPWAGQDRYMLFPNSMVNKGDTQFALSNHIEKAFDLAMQPKNSFGQTLGHLAYAHPFLEGNGRALFTFFEDHLRRQGLELNWTAMDQKEFLTAIDRQIADPNGDHLDLVLNPHLTAAKKFDPNKSTLLQVPWNNSRK